MTFGEDAERWLATRRRKDGQPLSVNTQSNYRRLLDGNLAPFKSQRLVAITYSTVKAWRDERIATGTISQTTAAYKLLSLIMREAVEEELIGRRRAG